MEYYLLSYLGLAVFILAAACRVFRQFSLPVHVRWELYPVQHESAARVAYGGSYLEEIDWWEKERHPSPWNEMRYMVPEILFLRGLRRENKALWLVSFPFHFGLYLMIATFGLLVLHGLPVLGTVPMPAGGGSAISLLDALIALTGWIGLILGSMGSLGLLCRRLIDRSLRRYSSIADYFHLLFIGLFFLCALVAAVSDPWLDGAKGYVFGLLTGGASLEGYRPGRSVAGAVSIVAASLLVAYMALTHMSHMFMKYFIYHQVKWDDAPNRPGSRIEAAIRKNLELRPNWGAAHVAADGRKTWRDIASSGPRETK